MPPGHSILQHATIILGPNSAIELNLFGIIARIVPVFV